MNINLFSKQAGELTPTFIDIFTSTRESLYSLFLKIATTNTGSQLQASEAAIKL